MNTKTPTHDIYIVSPDGILTQAQYTYSVEQAQALIKKGIMPALKRGYKYIIIKRPIAHANIGQQTP